MQVHNPSLAQCRRIEKQILRGVDARSFAELQDIIIIKGFPSCGLERDRFDRLQSAFHAIQGLRWAREDPAHARGHWVLNARRSAERLDLRLQ